MKKIIFVNVPISTTVTEKQYKVAGDSIQEYKGKVKSPINAILATTLKKEDKVKVVYIKEQQPKEQEDKHYEKALKQELEKINEKIGATIKYKVVSKSFNETSDVHEQLIEDLIDELEEKVEVSADITYGAKPLEFIIFNVLTFAVKFCGADINNIVYGKVAHDPNGTGKSSNPTIFDLSPLYYLNSISSTIKCGNMKEAKSIIKKIINMK